MSECQSAFAWDVFPRVVLISHRPLFRAVLCDAMKARANAEVVAEMESLAELDAKLGSIEADVVVIDASRTVGLYEYIAQVRSSRSTLRFMIVTDAVGDWLVNCALAAGATGILSYRDDPAELGDGLRVVARGGIFQGAAIISRRNEPAIYRMLTPQELRLTPYICRGLTDTGVAEALGLAAATVEGYRTRLLKKFGVTDTAALIAFGLKLGIVGVDEIDVSTRQRRSASTHRS